jgi:hypothetical protein
MGASRMSDALLQEAVNLVAQYGTSHQASLATGIPPGTIAYRYNMAQHRGIVAGAEVKQKPRDSAPSRSGSIGRTHMVIPDVQAKPGVSNDHLEWIANYALDKRPDVVIQIGDWADMPSLSSYDKGKRSYEGRRYIDDIDAARASVERFERVIDDYNRTHPEDTYNPEKKITGGNHEQRIVRATDVDPGLYGKLSLEDLGFQDYGWDYIPFLEVVKIDGVQYSHYFTSGAMGRPVSSAAALLRERQGSATMGHVQHTDMAIHKKTQRMALFCGICYLHDEGYLSPQDNGTRRQIIMKHEVEDGLYDPMFVSLNFLQKRYG